MSGISDLMGFGSEGGCRMADLMRSEGEGVGLKVSFCLVESGRREGTDGSEGRDCERSVTRLGSKSCEGSLI
jgi:hypothetical protein